MEDNDNSRENSNDIFANNRGVIKSWKGLVLFIGGFFFVIITLIVLSRIPSLQWLLVAVVGLYFLIGGMIGLRFTKGSTMPLVPIFLGLFLIFWGITDEFLPTVTGALGDTFFGAYLTLFGLVVIIYPKAYLFYIKKKYTETVEAVVVQVDHHYTKRGRTHRPVYSFTYQGKEYTVMNSFYISGPHPHSGDEAELLIDPDHPNRFIDMDFYPGRKISSYILPILIIALGIYLIVA